MKATVKRILKSTKKIDKIYSAVEQNQTTSDEIINSSDTVSENQPNEVIIDTAKIDRELQLEQMDEEQYIRPSVIFLSILSYIGCILIYILKFILDNNGQDTLFEYVFNGWVVGVFANILIVISFIRDEGFI